MKKQALSILLALVLTLSVSAFPVFAQSISEGDAVEYFGVIDDWGMDDLNLSGVDMTGIDLSAFESKSADDLTLEPTIVETPFPAAETDADGLSAKTLLDAGAANGSGSFVPCGDGKLNIELKIPKLAAQVPPEGTGGNIKNAIIVKSIKIKNISLDPVPGAVHDLQGCSVCDGGGKLKLTASGDAVIKGWVRVPVIYPAAPVTFDADIVYAMGPSAADEPPIAIVGATLTPKLPGFCQAKLNPTAQKATYEDCGGKLSYKVDVKVPANLKYVVPLEVWVNDTVYEDYICRYTVFGASGYPFGGDYCTPGYQIPLKEGQRIRFEAIIPDLVNPIAQVSGGATPDVIWRMGGTKPPILTTKANPVPGDCKAKIVPLPPLEPKNPAKDKPLKPSGWYNTYENAVVGLYQKCGRFAVMQIRLRNDGGETGYVTLPGAVAVNGGTPISYYWLSSTEPENGKVAIAPDEVVTLLGRLWLTNLTSQTHSDSPVNVSVNLAEIGTFMNGKLYSDRVNWRCY